MEKEKVAGYFNQQWEWAKIRANQKWAILFVSQDDLRVLIEEPRYIHQQLNCEFHEYKNEEHLAAIMTNRLFLSEHITFCENYKYLKFKIAFLRLQVVI